MPSKSDTSDESDVSTPGRTKVHQSVDVTSTEPTSEPKLPSERDESVGITGGVPSERVQQAHRDVERGLQDTSYGQATNDAYEKLKSGK